MKYLFFFVHPSKFHVFRNTINFLIKNGHQVKILITSKDVLEDLIKTEEWDYVNIFPEGRKIKFIHPYISAAINTIRTVYRISKYTHDKYDLFITDDLLVVNGWYRKIPTILFQDDDVTAVPESEILHYFTKYILTQEYSNMGKNSHKKIPMRSFKELGYLHPNKFKPCYSIVEKINPGKDRYFVLRLVSLKSTHDAGKNGLTDADVYRMISTLEKKGKVFITSERRLGSALEKYRLKVPVEKLAHILYYADFLISDSQTMSAEAGVLGTPYIRYNDFVGRISYLEDLEMNYILGFGIKTNNKDLLFNKIEFLLNHQNIKNDWKEKRKKMLLEKTDLTDFMIWLFEGYPASVDSVRNNPDSQDRFILHSYVENKSND
jgi:uncharacterized protein